MSNTSYLDDFMDKMVTVPNDINRFLRLIRKLDKRAEQLKSQLQVQQAKFLNQMKEVKDKKMTELPPHLKSELQSITKKQNQLYGFSKEKRDIAEQLASEVKEYQEMLKLELNNKFKDKTEEQILRRKKNTIDTTKNFIPSKKEEFIYDPKDSQYCYCGRTSFGEMVACENPYCQREWFHIVCIEQKNLPQKWYCIDCQKQKDKTRNAISRGFFVNKQAS